MNKVTIQSETTENPVSLMGKEAGIYWNSDISKKMRCTWILS